MRYEILCVAISAMAGSALAGVVVAETNWNSGGLEGWTFDNNGGGVWNYEAAGGNGGGYIQYVDDVDGTISPPPIFAPAEFLGDYTGYVGGYLEYDIILNGIATLPGEPTNYLRMRLEGANGSEARIIADYDIDSTWQTVRVNIVESEWEMISGTWADLISNVTAMRTGGDLITGFGPEGGLDNVRLVVPEAPFAGLIMFGAMSSIRRRRS